MPDLAAAERPWPKDDRGQCCFGGRPAAACRRDREVPPARGAPLGGFR